MRSRAASLLSQARQEVGAMMLRDQNQRDREGALRYILKGMGKGFLLYTVPLAVIQRKLTRSTIRRAAVVSVFVGLVRSFYRWHKWLRALDAEQEQRPLVRWMVHLFQQKLPWMAIAGGAAAWVGLQIDPSLMSSTLAFWCLVIAGH